ncbi:F-box protein SKIP22-like [Carex rostrata]
MKLRIRSIATKETIRITAPDASSLLDLKTLIAASLAATSTSPNPIVPDSIHLSLNQTDELLASNATDPLSSLGLTSGDLLFFSFSPFRQTLAQVPNTIPPVSNLSTKSSSNNPIDNHNKETTVNPMEVDVGPAVLEESDNTHLIPGFLVELMEIKTEEDASILRRVVMLTHASMLDAGFILLNGAGSNLPHGWTLQASSLCLKYTTSDFVNQVQALNEKVAVLKFSVLGNLVTTYGYVAGVNPHFYRFCFDLAKVATLFSLDLNSMSRESEQEFMEKFRGVKDGVSLPLMIDLCLKNGLPLPPCFMFLSIDTKSKIMDLLPGTDVVRIGSTCKEMWNLSLDEKLWRQKMEREFGNSLNENTDMSWRERYKRAYIAKKNAVRFRPRQSNSFLYGPTARRIGSGRHFIIGGDVDRFPMFGADLREAGTSVFGRRGLPGRQVSPRCNFGGRI